MKLAYNSQRHTIYPCDALRLIQHDEFLSFSSYFIYLSVHYIIRVLCFVFYAFLYAFRCPRMPGYFAYSPSPCHHYEKCTDSTSLLYVVHVNGTLIVRNVEITTLIVSSSGRCPCTFTIHNAQVVVHFTLCVGVHAKHLIQNSNILIDLASP